MSSSGNFLPPPLQILYPFVAIPSLIRGLFRDVSRPLALLLSSGRHVP